MTSIVSMILRGVIFLHSGYFSSLFFFFLGTRFSSLFFSKTFLNCTLFPSISIKTNNFLLHFFFLREMIIHPNLPMIVSDEDWV